MFDRIACACGAKYPPKLKWKHVNCAPVPKCEFSTVVHAEVVHAEANGSSRHGKYADAEARREYRRKWAVDDRAKKRQANGGT